MCGTLKPTSYGFDLDLSTPDAHKTAAIFGPSTTPVPATACALLKAWVTTAGLSAAPNPYVFVLGSARGGGGGGVDHAQPVNDKCWTKVVQAVFKRGRLVFLLHPRICAALSSLAHWTRAPTVRVL